MTHLNSVIIASLFAMFLLTAALGVIRLVAIVHLKYEKKIAMPIRFLIGLLTIAMFGYIPGIFIGKLQVIASMEGIIAFTTTLVVCSLLYRKVLLLPNIANAPR